MPSLDQIQKQLKDFIVGLTVKQRVLLVGAAVLTIAVLAAFAHLISTPDYVPLMTGMEPADAQALGEKLAAKNISYQLSPDGKGVNVPSDKLDSSRMEIASDGMPHSGRLGFELFDKLNWGQTEFDEKVNYQRALEGELERSIQTLRDVESVRVHLVMSSDSVFLDRERAAKASVILKLRSGQLSEETQQGIARLVSGAVDKLSPENVTVIDADTNRPLGTRRHGFSSTDEGLEDEYTAKLLQTLEPVVGQHVRASVNVEYDPSTAEENRETYDPESAVAVSTQRSEEQVGGSMAGGVPGTSSNVPGGNGGAKIAVEGGDGMQISKSESNTFAVNKVVRRTVEPAGRIRRVSAALLVDDAIDVKQENGKRSESHRKRTPDELKQIEDLAKAAIGIDVNRGDSLTVENISFEQSPVDPPAKPPIVERVRTTLNDWSSIVRYAALILLFLLVYMLLLRPLKKQLLTTFKELPSKIAAKAQPANPAELAAGQEAQMTPEQARAAALKKQLVEKVTAEPAATGKLIQSWLHEGVR
ncbi:MAG: flagellar basal-body MS-ring/collar protein FliF [Candidatus Sulfotelmatobacter sp.]|jgi:flagellar M-ring protein FliF